MEEKCQSSRPEHKTSKEKAMTLEKKKKRTKG